MSDYRDERYALEQRIAALESARVEAQAKLAKQTREVENARRALDARPRLEWSRRQWSEAIIGGFLLLLSVLPCGVALTTPDPRPCPEAPVAVRPDGLGLFVWGTLTSAPNRPTVKERCMFWIDIVTNRLDAAVTGLEITCNGQSIHRWSKLAAGGAPDAPVQIVVELEGHALGAYALRYEGIAPSVDGPKIRIDTEKKSASIETVPGKKWVFGLDGRAQPRSSRETAREAPMTDP